MSYAPIYAKLRDLEERLIKIETVPPAISSLPNVNTVVSSSGIDLTKLLNDCSLNSSSITQLSTDIAMLATKEELVSLATKAELPDVSVLATKEELVSLATKEELVSKDELASLFAKFDNIINVVAQLNTRIDDLYTKIPVSA